jgi:hypothetical protein
MPAQKLPYCQRTRTHLRLDKHHRSRVPIQPPRIERSMVLPRVGARVIATNASPPDSRIPAHQSLHGRTLSSDDYVWWVLRFLSGFSRCGLDRSRSYSCALIRLQFRTTRIPVHMESLVTTIREQAARSWHATVSTTLHHAVAGLFSLRRAVPRVTKMKTMWTAPHTLRKRRSQG